MINKPSKLNMSPSKKTESQKRVISENISQANKKYHSDPTVKPNLNIESDSEILSNEDEIPLNVLSKTQNTSKIKASKLSMASSEKIKSQHTQKKFGVILTQSIVGSILTK